MEEQKEAKLWLDSDNSKMAAKVSGGENLFLLRRLEEKSKTLANNHPGRFLMSFIKDVSQILESILVVMNMEAAAEYLDTPLHQLRNRLDQTVEEILNEEQLLGKNLYSIGCYLQFHGYFLEYIVKEQSMRMAFVKSSSHERVPFIRKRLLDSVPLSFDPDDTTIYLDKFSSNMAYRHEVFRKTGQALVSAGHNLVDYLESRISPPRP